MSKAVTCIECKAQPEYPTGKIRDGGFTCSTCLDQAEMDMRWRGAKIIYIGFAILIPIMALVRFC